VKVEVDGVLEGEFGVIGIDGLDVADLGEGAPVAVAPSSLMHDFI
jgi:hypothetical protein